MRQVERLDSQTKGCKIVSSCSKEYKIIQNKHLIQFHSTPYIEKAILKYYETLQIHTYIYAV